MLGAALGYMRLMQNTKLSPEEIEKMQWRKFKEILAYAYDQVPFYREKFQKVRITPDDIQSRKDIAKIPVTTKEELRKAGNKIFATGYAKNNCKSSRTSGAKGLPFTSYFDTQAWHLLKYASKLRARRLCLLNFGSKVVNIECENKQAIKKLNNRPWYQDKVLKLRYLTVFDDIKQHIHFYTDFKPDALYGLTSYFLQLGHYIHRNSIKWNPPKIIFTSGEMLDVHTKNKLQNYFGSQVYDIYGSTELKEVAWECPKHEGYHINEDLYLVEFINKDKSADDGEIVVTSLVNHAMPLIRYDTGDRGKALEKRCSCGLPFALMGPSQGRAVDYFILPDKPPVSPYALTMTIEQIQGILQYQIIQHTNVDIEVKIRPLDSCSEQMKQDIRRELKKLLGESIKIHITPYQQIPREKSGKYQVVKSEVKM